MNPGFLLDLALILIFCKLLSLLMKKIRVPQVVGAILAGLLIGPNALGLVRNSDPLVAFAGVGVLLLMFSAGLETDLREIKSTGPVALFVAAMGVLLPLGGGYLLYSLFHGGFAPVGSPAFLSAIFTGTIMTATSVGITVEVLRELGKLKSKVGTIILSAAIIDDVIGIVLLAFVSGLNDPDSHPIEVVVKTVLFFAATVVAGFLFHFLFQWLEKRWDHHNRIPIFALCTCFLFSWAAETIFGIADITGAFMAGVIIRTVKPASEYVEQKIDINSYMIFTPVFFASIGIKTVISTEDLTLRLLLFALSFAIVAMLCKLIGCALAARIGRFDTRDSLRIGAGMMARGEVAMIVATKGFDAGVLDSVYSIAVIALIIISSITTPIILKALYAKKHA